MSEQNFKDTMSNRERNIDALFGFLHIKDRPFLHQRAAQHMFGENDSSVIVPINTMRNVWDEYGSKAGRTLRIAFLAALVIGVVAFSAYLFRLDPGFLIPFM